MRVSLLFCLAMLGCTQQMITGVKPSWELVADEVDLVVDDPSQNAIYVRAHDDLGHFGGGEALVPSLRDVPSHAVAYVTAMRGLRWRADDHDVWHGWNPGPGRAADARPSIYPGDVPHAGVAAPNVLFEVPDIGPEHGVPLKRGELKGFANAPTAMRGNIAIAANERGIATFDLGSGKSRAFSHSASVMPAISSDARFEAACLGRVLVPPHPGFPPVMSDAVGVFEGLEPVEAVAIHDRPVSLHFAQNALFVELPDHTLWRHVLPKAVKTSFTPSESAANADREKLFAQLRSDDLVAAVDALDAMLRRGYLDLPTSDEATRAGGVRERARTYFETEVQNALTNQDYDWAAVLDRRMRLIDGRGAGAEAVRIPALRIATSATGAEPFFASHPVFERAANCADGTDCLEVAPASSCGPEGIALPCRDPSTALAFATERALLERYRALSDSTPDARTKRLRYLLWLDPADGELQASVAGNATLRPRNHENR